MVALEGHGTIFSLSRLPRYMLLLTEWEAGSWGKVHSCDPTGFIHKR